MFEIPTGLQAVSIDSSGTVELFAITDTGDERISVLAGENNGEIFKVSMPTLAQLGLELGCCVSREEIISGFQNAVDGIPVPLLVEIDWEEVSDPTRIKSMED